MITVLAGGAGIYFGWRINGRRFVFDAPSRIVGRLAVGCVPVGVAIFLATFEGFWLSWLTLAISFASLFVVRQLIPETRTATVDWPSLIFALVVVPLTVLAVWAVFQI